MDRDQVVARLRGIQPELQAEGIVRLCLHGAVARGESGPSSDVDLIVEFDSKRRYSIVEMVRLEDRLAELLGARVELSPFQLLQEGVRERALREGVVVF
jgi:predicted nucleotidyltransferase